MLTWKQAQDTRQWLHWDCNSVVEWSFRVLEIVKQRDKSVICSLSDIYRWFSYPMAPRNNRQTASIDSPSNRGKICCRRSKLEDSTVRSALSSFSSITEFACSIVQRRKRYRGSITFEDVVRSLFATELSTGISTRIIAVVTRKTFSMILIIHIVPSECQSEFIEPFASSPFILTDRPVFQANYSVVNRWKSRHRNDRHGEFHRRAHQTEMYYRFADTRKTRRSNLIELLVHRTYRLVQIDANDVWISFLRWFIHIQRIESNDESVDTRRWEIRLEKPWE